MKRETAFLLAILLALAIPATAAQHPAAPTQPDYGSSFSVGHRALAPLVIDQKIKMMLRDGTYVEGRVITASEEVLTLKVTNVEPKGRLKKGEAAIATPDIAVVYMKKKGSVALPVALGVAGGLGGFVLGSYVGWRADSPALQIGLAFGLAATGAAGGAYGGIEAAKRPVTINVASPK
jgi:hypothetical protein